ncbi:MAG: sporulation protein YqfD [Bacillota bacterium]
MGRKRIKEYLQGYVRVEVRGKNPERLVNLCLSAGFPMWDFDTGESSVFFCTTLQRYRDIHRLARRARCAPRIVRRVGLPFTLGKVRRRPTALIAAAIVMLALLYLSGSIWSIQVTGTDKVEPGRVLQAAASTGLVPGARRSRVSADAAEAAILDQNPEIAWAYVRFQGTLAVIEVVERVRPEAVGPGDVVASKDGVVQSVLVLSGAPVVHAGQTVKAGDLLIAGNPSGALAGARGNVAAMVWYEMYKEVPLVQPVAQRTGRRIEMTVIRRGTNEFVLWGKGNSFEWYEVEDYPIFSAFGGSERETKIVNRVLYEVQWTQKVLSPEEAFTAAEKLMREAILEQLPSLAKLVDLSCKVESSTQDMIHVRATASAIEEIGVIRPWQGRDSEVDR